MAYHQVRLLVEPCIYLSIHNPQVYAIDSISYSTLSKLIRPLIVLSFNLPKPTKGLDALTQSNQDVHVCGCMVDIYGG